jgi:hypothetical protein
VEKFLEKLIVVVVGAFLYLGVDVENLLVMGIAWECVSRNKLVKLYVICGMNWLCMCHIHINSPEPEAS